MFTVQKYSEWNETAHKLHMCLQMIGKTKLNKCFSQPEWNHSLLSLTTDGFTSGLIPDNETGFAIHVDVNRSMVAATCTNGMRAQFLLSPSMSVNDCYQQYEAMLQAIGHYTPINPKPQEVADTRPFDQQTEKLDWDPQAAMNYYQSCVFAHNSLLRFASPFRGKKILPSLFWGTFDMTTVLFSGVERPFPGKGLIEKVAFSEQLIEFGYWPGDPATDDPMFFVLAYPFVQGDLSGKAIEPSEAFYSHEKKEFFLPAAGLLQHENPEEVLQQFLKGSFQILTGAENWPSLDWFTKPVF